MTAVNLPECAVNRRELADLCAGQLRDEEAQLAVALRMLRGVKNAFTARGIEAYTAALDAHHKFVLLIERLNLRRQRFRADVAARLRMAPAEVTLTRAAAALPMAERSRLAAEAERVRRLADEVAAQNYWLSVHVRIHLDAYQRILRDLTNTAADCGRYGPGGRTDALEFRPMIHVHG